MFRILVGVWFIDELPLRTGSCDVNEKNRSKKYSVFGHLTGDIRLDGSPPNSGILTDC
jgi:hypothetical protein